MAGREGRGSYGSMDPSVQFDGCGMGSMVGAQLVKDALDASLDASFVVES
jgi:hypothetical protein